MKPYYQSGGVTIFHGDCKKLMRSLPDGSVDVLFCDPPYGHENHVKDLNAQLNKHRKIKDQPIENDSQELMRDVVDGALLEAARVLKQDCCCCCCCCCGGGGPRPTFAWVADRMDHKGLQFFHAVIWDKRNPGLGWRYRRQYEMVMVAHRKGGTLAWADPDKAVPNIKAHYPDRNRLHPNEKPVALVEWFLKLHTPKHGVVLDPFMGSGTTLLAARNLGFNCVGMEISEAYCEMAAKRLSYGRAATKKTSQGFDPLFKLD